MSTPETKSKTPWKTIGAFLGGGLMMFLLTICGLAIGASGLFTDWINMQSSEKQQAEHMGILEEQLDIQETISAKLSEAYGAPDGPTATALALEIVSLEKTKNALSEGNSTESEVNSPAQTNTPASTITPRPTMAFPFSDAFSNGFNSDIWTVISGTPLIKNETLTTASEEVLILEIGDTSLDNFTISFDYEGLRSFQGIKLEFKHISFYSDSGSDCVWAYREGTRWEDLSDCDSIYTWGSLQIDINGNRYDVSKNGNIINNITYGENHQGAFRIYIDPGVQIDNFTIHVNN